MPDEAPQDQLESIVERWKAMPVGIRPPQSDISVYKQAILATNPQPDAAVLLLGSTPELRDLILQLKLKLTSCDVDMIFWQAMSKLLSFEGEEEFIHTNWLELDSDRQYNFIIGDCPLNMLTWEEIQELVSKFHKMLNKNGRIILRLQSINEELTMDTLRQAIADYPQERTDRLFLAHLHCLTESLRNRHYPEQTRREFYESVVSQYLTLVEMDNLRPILRDRRNCYPNHKSLNHLLLQHFEILQCKPSSAPTWGTAYIYILKLHQPVPTLLTSGKLHDQGSTESDLHSKITRPQPRW